VFITGLVSRRTPWNEKRLIRTDPFDVPAAALAFKQESRKIENEEIEKTSTQRQTMMKISFPTIWLALAATSDVVASSEEQVNQSIANISSEESLCSRLMIMAWTIPLIIVATLFLLLMRW
jgi:hypothetical protein